MLNHITTKTKRPPKRRCSCVYSDFLTSGAVGDIGGALYAIGGAVPCE